MHMLIESRKPQYVVICSFLLFYFKFPSLSATIIYKLRDEFVYFKPDLLVLNKLK